MTILTSRGSLDYDGFTDMMMDLLNRAWGTGWGSFAQDEPTGNDPDNVVLPAITFDTFARIRSETHKSLEPVLYQQFRDPDNPNQMVKLYRMWFDVEMDFFVYHTTNREARLLMDDFESFLFTYRSYFKEQGISDIYFLAETKPMVVTKWGKSLPQRNLRYLVRIERITEVRSNIVQQIDTSAEASLQDPATSNNVASQDFINAYKSIQKL